MNIHLVEDEKFINYSFETFEKYYPDQNIFFVKVDQNSYSQLEFVKPNERVIPVCLYKSTAINTILKYCDSDHNNIFVHYLEGLKATVALTLQSKINATIYWIAYGADLYSLLEKKGKYELKDYEIDSSSSYNTWEYLKKVYPAIMKRINYRRISLSAAIDDFIDRADYFCFWNHYDYKLLQKHISSKPDFKYFRYFDAFKEVVPERSNQKDARNILVNHSASVDGNHLTILSKLNEIDSKRSIRNIFVPLSYGNVNIKKMVLEYGQKNLSYALKPIEKFLTRDKYHKILNRVGVGFFGHRRQEAAGNIYYLLATGAKIFLRSDNNLLNYYREKGYHLYEFEKDFNSIDDLVLLEEQKQIKNRKIVKEEFSQNEKDRTYKNLIE